MDKEELSFGEDEVMKIYRDFRKMLEYTDLVPMRPICASSS